MKTYELTPGAQRALAFAARWNAGNPHAPLEPAQLLLGLLEEPECRAALLLADRGIGVAAVRQHWPQLEPSDPARSNGSAARLSAEVREALQAAELRLADYVRPFELATEHLLLGLAVGQNDVALWFVDRGLDAVELETEIHRLAGHQPGALEPGGLSIEPIDVPDIDVANIDIADIDAVDIAAEIAAEPPAPAHAAANERRAEPPVSERSSVWRILDAAANRAGEGLRVIEDFVRFALDDRFLTTQCKTLRHDLAAALAVFPLSRRHAARETRRDVGTRVSLASEQARAGAREVVAAGFQRVQQALRSLEEYAKTCEPAAAARFESLRYQSYTLQRAIEISADSMARLAETRMYVLIDGRPSAQEFDRFVDALVLAGADVIQLRDKRLSDRDLMARARALRARTRGTRTLFIANDRPDLALLAEADGVHVGQDELAVKDVRAIVGPDMLLGVSTHSIEQARAAVLDGADYIGVGPTFPSRTKHFSYYPGLELLKQVAGEIRLPAFAVGGISSGNVAEVRACGITRIAVSGAVTDQADPGAALADLRRRLE